MQGESIHLVIWSRPYDPNRLLDLAAHHLGMRNDAALAQRLKVARSVIHGVRHHAIPVTPSLLLWLHEASGIPLTELRGVLGDQRRRIRPSVLLIAKTPATRKRAT